VASLTVERLFEPNNDAVPEALTLKARSSTGGRGGWKSWQIIWGENREENQTTEGANQTLKLWWGGGQVLDQKKWQVSHYFNYFRVQKEWRKMCVKVWIINHELEEKYEGKEGGKTEEDW